MTMGSDQRDAQEGLTAVYGLPPREVVEVPHGAVQTSPLVPGARPLEDIPDGSLAAAIVLAPPGTIERRYVLAQILRALAPGALLVALAPKDKGGQRLAAELRSFGAAGDQEPRRHHRIARARRPARLDADAVAAAIAAGSMREHMRLGLWTEPGIFSWDRVDPGTALLIAHLPPLKGRGADFGCGAGALARAALAASPDISEILLVDVDRRAIACAGRNVTDARARFAWADVAALAFPGAALDFVVMNPPFHDGGAEDRALGIAFIRRAAEILARGGRLYLVANRHLPYEAELAARYGSVRLLVEDGGFKVYEAIR